jgi:ATP-dependent protease HslVU (ClpYQ) peptidase subunit
MTIIIGWVENNEAWIGSDSAVTLGYKSLILPHSKYIGFYVGKEKRPFLVGVAGSLRVSQLVESVSLPAHNNNPRKFVLKFVETVRERLKDSGAIIEENSEQSGDFKMLMVYGNKLFTAHTDFGVMESSDPFAAIGSGQDYAMGVLSALRDTMSPRDCIHNALRITSRYDIYCSPPLRMKHITL